MATLRDGSVADGQEQAQGRDSNRDGNDDSSVSFDLNWQDEEDLQATIHLLDPPELPRRLSPAQAAQLSELIEYLHIRIRNLLNSVQVNADETQVTLDMECWQYLLDLQARLATYLRQIGEPGEE